MKIDVWSDLVCPFCYIGKRRLEGALAEFPHRDEVEVVWHSFQLDPSAPPVSEEPTAQMVARKYGIPLAQAEQNQRQLEAQAATVGLEYHLDRTRTGNTLDGHRLIHLAAEQGLADAAHERFMRAYFTEGEPIGDRATLARLADEVGLPADRVRAVLDGDEYAEDVERDQARAHAYGARGVPFFVLADAVGVSGAQPHEVFVQALDQAWATAHPLEVVGGDDGAVCEGDACAL
ncbi:MAG: DsbA family oxidoreductase [Acidimicrobiia bacterium]